MPSKIINKLLSSGLLKQSALYSIFNVLNAAIPFLLIPFLSRALTPQEYGIITLYTTAISFLMPFISLNLQGAITNKFYSKDTINISEYIGNSVLILLTTVAIGIFIVNIYSLDIEAFIKFPSNWLWSIVVVCGVQTLMQICLVNWQMQGKAFSFGLFQLSFSLINFSLTLYLVYHKNLKWEARIISHTLVSSLWGIFALGLLFLGKKVNFSFNKLYIKNALNFGVPLIPHALGGFLIAMTDKVLIANMIGVEATGLYGVGFQVGSVLSIITSAFNLAYVPWLFSNLKEENVQKKQKIVKFTYLYFVGLILFVGFSAAILPFINAFFLGEKFINSYSISLWVLTGFAFNGMYLMVTNYIFYVEKTRYLGMTTLIVGILNVFLCHFLIRKLGIIGAAVSTAISYGICFAVTWYLSNLVYPMPWLNLKNNSQ